MWNPVFLLHGKPIQELKIVGGEQETEVWGTCESSSFWVSAGSRVSHSCNLPVCCLMATGRAMHCGISGEMQESRGAPWQEVSLGREELLLTAPRWSVWSSRGDEKLK